MANPELAQRFLAGHIERLRKLPKKRIVFPEGDDPRIEEAAQRLIDERLVEPILIGSRHTVPDGRYGRLLDGEAQRLPLGAEAERFQHSRQLTG